MQSDPIEWFATMNEFPSKKEADSNCDEAFPIC